MSSRFDPAATERACTTCRVVKPLELFYKASNPRAPYGRDGKCRECQREQRKRWARAYKRRTRLGALGAYSNGDIKCACCGERTLMFLTLDHIGGGGTAHRRSLGTSRQFYMHLKMLGYPLGLRVLCWNCNSGSAVNGGVCPHVSEAAKVGVS